MDRRILLSAGAMFGIGSLSACASGTKSTIKAPAGPNSKPFKEIGVQLYTLRELFKTDYQRTLDKIAEFGIKDLEFAGYYNHRPTDVKGYMDSLGLVSNCSHVKIADLRNNYNELVETAQIMGQSHLIIPSIPKTERNPDGYKAIAKLLNKCGQASKDAGVTVAYHNHGFEFNTVGGQVGYDILLRETDPAFVSFEIDLFWTHLAGVKPRDLFKKAPGRFVACHIKDSTGSGKMVAIGEGVIDFDTIFKDAKLAGLKYFYIEHDNPRDPALSVSKSAKHLLT